MARRGVGGRQRHTLKKRWGSLCCLPFTASLCPKQHTSPAHSASPSPAFGSPGSQHLRHLVLRCVEQVWPTSEGLSLLINLCFSVCLWTKVGGLWPREAGGKRPSLTQLHGLFVNSLKFLKFIRQHQKTIYSKVIFTTVEATAF